MHDDQLPPWGKVSRDYLKKMKSLPYPGKWMASDSDDVRLKQWGAWRDVLRDEIAAHLWPTYDPDQRCWRGSPNTKLLDADFQLLLLLSPQIDQPVLGRATPAVPHRKFFREEDGNGQDMVWGQDYGRYDPSLDAARVAWIGAILNADVDDIEGHLTLELKQQFQRPRPYQVALIENRNEFSCLDALSANTPSMISGHCLQGALAGCVAYSCLASLLTSDSIEILKHFAVDIGDRRVFAGVHYPSDNFSSWYCALKLIPYVFDQGQVKAVKAFLWDAIENKSVVYDAIKGHVWAENDAGRVSPYAAMNDAMRKLI